MPAHLEASRTIREPARDLPVRAEVDVLVAGGGLGGVAAATAAARAGADTLLVERNGFLGGVATAGLCCSVFNAYYTGEHDLAVTGIAVEVADQLAAGGGTSHVGPELAWHDHKGHIIYDVEWAKGALERLVMEAGPRGAPGASVLYDTVISDVIMVGDAVRGVVIESKSGREAILARVVIDATGDADLAVRAGAPVHMKSPRAIHSYCFRLGRVDVDAFVQYLIDHPDQYPEYMDVDWTFDEALAHYRATGTFLLPHGGAMQMDVFKRARATGEYPERIGLHDTLDACQMHAMRDTGIVHLITGFVHFDDLDIGTISRSMVDGRRMAGLVSGFFREHVPGFDRSFIIATADDLGIRASRWIDGDTVFTAAMRANPSRCDDAVARGAVQRNMVKHRGERAWGVQTFPGGMFDVPYGCLLPRGVEGLLMGAGRSVSVEEPFLLRVMAHTMMVGQAAGGAAAVAVREGTMPRAVDVALVQAELGRQGVVLDHGA